MAYGDYENSKPMDIPSVTGTPTVSKAQPVLLVGEEVWDDFEDGDVSEWTVESGEGSNFTASTTNPISGTYSGRIESGSGGIIVSRSGLSSTGSTGFLEFRFYIDDLGGSDDARFELYDSSGTSLGDLYINEIDSSTYEIQFRNGTTTDTLSGQISTGSSSINNVALNFDFSSDTVDIVVNGSETTGLNLQNSVSNFDEIEIISGANLTDRTEFVVDDFLSASEKNKGPGDIVIDWTNVSSESDLAVYDQNDNLLPYEVESFDATSETAVLWLYDSWVRDGSSQAKVVYGGGPASSEEGTPAEVWGNTGQNTVIVQHLQDDPLTATDSSPNGNDGTVDGSVSATGQFDGAASFDGQDDRINLPQAAASFMSTDGNNFTIVSWFNANSFSDPWNLRDGSDVHLSSSSSSLELTIFDGSINNATKSTSLSTNTWYHAAGVYNADTDTVELFLDGVGGDTATSGNPTSQSGENELGARSSGSTFFDGLVDEFRIYSDAKSDAWLQADYDASPKGGQVFFSQQAAQTIQSTIAVPVTELSASTPEPAVTGGAVTVASPVTSLTSNTQEPVVSPGNAPVSAPTTNLTIDTQEPAVFIEGLIRVPATELTLSTEEPNATGGPVTVEASTTNLSTSTQEPTIFTDLFISAPVTELSTNTQEPAVTPGPTSISLPSTTLSLTTLPPDLAVSLVLRDLSKTVTINKESDITVRGD